jgi:sigma-B regulation protein RsbU (phosphoserine phosphatase)
MVDADSSDAKLGKTLIEDIRSKVLRPTAVSRDWRDVRDFFLNDEKRKRLSEMKWYKRWFYKFFWLLKSLFLRLSAVRRILLVISLFLLLTSGNIGLGNENIRNIIGIIILLFILMLELKDKLLARNELIAGRIVQSELLPQKSPLIQGWDVWLFTRPANDVGGDLVDYIRLAPNRFGLILADVAGKGLGAALLMAKLQATVRALTPDYKSLADLGKKINEIFYRDTHANCFASLIYIEIRPDTGDLALLNAGHIPPLVAKHTKISELSKGTAALGLAANTNYAEQSLHIENNEFLLIYSDGLTEARNDDGEFFGDNRILSLLSDLNNLNAEQICQKLVENVDQFTGNAPQNDDLSLIIVKRKT